MNRKEQQQAEAEAREQENEWLRKSRILCRVCGGVGSLIVYRLVTYHGKSLTIKKVEAVAESEWRALAERIASEPIGADRQQVLSAAKECQCRKARVLV